MKSSQGETWDSSLRVTGIWAWECRSAYKVTLEYWGQQAGSGHRQWEWKRYRRPETLRKYRHQFVD